MQGSQPGRMSCLGSALFQEGLPSRATQAGGRLAQLLHVPDEAVKRPHHLVGFGRPALVQLGLQGAMWASVSHQCSVPSAMGTKQS